jgi:hypothetical protein
LLHRPLKLLFSIFSAIPVPNLLTLRRAVPDHCAPRFIFLSRFWGSFLYLFARDPLLLAVAFQMMEGV